VIAKACQPFTELSWGAPRHWGIQAEDDCNDLSAVPMSLAIVGNHRRFWTWRIRSERAHSTSDGECRAGGIR
jgi:hypothetical protein